MCWRGGMVEWLNEAKDFCVTQGLFNTKRRC